ncbi:MAG: S-adenosylmethionine:tRNA ribosyltransferase-isomerase [Phycisphaerae bacterium]|nr:MAG: S-adenosylmethionine:tRNA ribosyltransferase-isomerase [Phycisphaerae bacterium]
MLPVRDLDYELPESAIATAPAQPRDSARLMVVPHDGPPVHTRITDLPSFLRSGDLLVLNVTRVAPARFVGVRADTGGRAEGLYLRDDDAGWVVLLRARRLKSGMRVTLHTADGADAHAALVLGTRVESEPGAWKVQVEGRPGETPRDVLRRVGLTPLPPYILRAREHTGLVVPDEVDQACYQTVFAGDDARSVAAPTAGLHLTPALLDALRAMGVRTAEVVLHVGTGTFKPVETEFVEQHPMHEEWCFMSEAAAEAVRRTRNDGGRVVAVGTTAARTLETYAAGLFGAVPGQWSATRLLITPGFRWRWTDRLLTNFHLPRSTLMAMVAAKVGGAERLVALYTQALREGYRFYSYGDAMLVG